MRRAAPVAGAALVLVLLPLVLSGPATARLAEAGAYSVAILGLGLLARAGQLSLGQGAFVSVGAYVTANLATEHGLSDLATIPIAAGVAAIAGAVVALPALRLPGHALAVITVGLAVAVSPLAERLPGVTGGATGLAFSGAGGDTAYAVSWTVVAGLVVLCAFLARGRVLRAVRENERAATVSGIPVAAAKVLAFAFACACGGAAGSLIAIVHGSVGPQTVPVMLSFTLVAGMLIGFYGSPWGAVLGGLAVEYGSDLVHAVPHAAGGERGPVELGFGVIVVALVHLWPLAQRRR